MTEFTTLWYKMFPVQCKKNNKAGNSLNAVERKPVPTRVLNPNANETSLKPKQLGYRKTKLKKTGGKKTGVEKT